MDSIQSWLRSATGTQPKVDTTIHTKIITPLHPYYPVGVEVAGYIANEYSMPQIFSVFGAGCAVILSGASFIAKRFRPQISAVELATVLWFALCGAIHLVVEGYFAYNYRDLAGHTTFMGQLWKEYANADSRYLTKDPFVWSMETITAFAWGPLSFYVAGLIVAEHPLRYPLQLIVSLGQLYGDVLYYATNVFNHYIHNTTFSRPEAIYFWGYYVAINMLWIIIPFLLIVSAVNETARALRGFDKVSSSLKSSRALRDLQTNGTAEKKKR